MHEVFVDAALNNGHYGLGAVIFKGEDAIELAHTGGKAKPGADAEYYEKEAILFGIRVCRENKIENATIYTDNRNAAYVVESKGFTIRCMQEDGIPPLAESMHGHAHYHAKLGLKDAKRE